MKLIFLDVDGVLNHEQYYQRVRGGKKIIRLPDEAPHGAEDIDPESVKALNFIIEKTGAKVVFSSSWRTSHTIESITEVLDYRGFKGEVISMTPKLYFQPEYGYSVPRGCEIKAWMETNKDKLNNKMSRVPYVILDDDSDMMYWQRNNFLHIDRFVGLTYGMANRAISILNRYSK